MIRVLINQPGHKFIQLSCRDLQNCNLIRLLFFRLQHVFAKFDQVHERLVKWIPGSAVYLLSQDYVSQIQLCITNNFGKHQ